MFSLPENISTRINDELFYYKILQHTKHLHQKEQDTLKSKIRRPFESYLQIKTPYKCKKAIKNITGTKNTIILKQDKGHRVVILNHRYNIEKCLKMLVSDQFK